MHVELAYEPPQQSTKPKTLNPKPITDRVQITSGGQL